MGSVLVTAGLFGIVYGFSNGETLGWGAVGTWGLLAVGVVVLAWDSVLAGGATVLGAELVDPVVALGMPFAGKPIVKILGQPRDVKKAMEWMNVVMVNRFVTLDGQKLKCKTCHQDKVGSPGFERKVILTDHLPPHPHDAASAPPTALPASK